MIYFCGDWSSLKNRQVLWGSHLFASSISEKYLRSAFFIALLVLFRSSLNCSQIKGSFEEVAFLFRKSFLYIPCDTLFMIYGKLLFLVLFVLKGAFLSTTLVTSSFQTSPYHLSYRMQYRDFSHSFEDFVKFNVVEVLKLSKFNCLIITWAKNDNKKNCVFDLWMTFFGGRG